MGYKHIVILEYEATATKFFTVYQIAFQLNGIEKEQQVTVYSWQCFLHATIFNFSTVPMGRGLWTFLI